jgi:hypothetical protein
MADNSGLHNRHSQIRGQRHDSERNRFISIPLERIGELNVSRRADGSGTIRFGRTAYVEDWHGSSLSDHRHYGYRRIEPPSFELIDDVLAVRDLIVGAQMRPALSRSAM